MTELMGESLPQLYYVRLRLYHLRTGAGDSLDSLGKENYHELYNHKEKLAPTI